MIYSAGGNANLYTRRHNPFPKSMAKSLVYLPPSATASCPPLPRWRTRTTSCRRCATSATRGSSWRAARTRSSATPQAAGCPTSYPHVSGNNHKQERFPSWSNRVSYITQFNILFRCIILLGITLNPWSYSNFNDRNRSASTIEAVSEIWNETESCVATRRPIKILKRCNDFCC